MGTPVVFVKQHAILAATLHISLTLSPHFKCLKIKLTILFNLEKFLSGISWGSYVATPLRLYNVPFAGFLRYGIPVLYGMSRSTLTELESIQAQALRACLGLLRGASKIGTLAVPWAISRAILRREGTMHVHLRHSTRHRRHHLSSVPKTWPGSCF